MKSPVVKEDLLKSLVGKVGDVGREVTNKNCIYAKSAVSSQHFDFHILHVLQQNDAENGQGKQDSDTFGFHETATDKLSAASAATKELATDFH